MSPRNPERELLQGVSISCSKLYFQQAWPVRGAVGVPLQAYDYPFIGSIDLLTAMIRFIGQIVVKFAYGAVGDWPSYGRQARLIFALILAGTPAVDRDL